MPKTLQDISKAMADIDFCMLSTITSDGGIAARPMSNNSEVEYDGDSWFFTCDDAATVSEIEANPNVGLSFSGKAGVLGLVGKPGLFIAVEGKGKLIRDKAQFAKHWTPGLDHWFKQGIDTPGLVLINVHAEHVHYWDGEDQGEVKLTG